MKVLQTPTSCPVKMWTDGVPVEERAIDQLLNVARMPFIFKHVAVMPDVHLGVGATVGSVIPTQGAVIPAAVGVDIGCGMMAVRVSHPIDNLGLVRRKIEAAVPVGNGPGGAHVTSRTSPGRKVNAEAQRLWVGYINHLQKHGIRGDRIESQLGTLGGGNHFIELCEDENGDMWIMLHSGSRGTGNMIGQYFIELAREDMRQWHINLPDKDLAYLPEGTDHFNEYVAAVAWAQDYAATNRHLMMDAIIDATGLSEAAVPVVQCHHNYLSQEGHFGDRVWVTRKGAVDASLGKMGIIPGSMGQRSYIVRGKGNADSFRSCSHGAGRAMSRTEARKRFTVEDLKAQTEGVECRKDEGVVDEIPSAYKNLDAVMEAQSDLVEIVHTLKAVLTVKG